MRAAAVQLQSTPDRDRNLETADRLDAGGRAGRRGARRAARRSGPRSGTPEQTIAAAEPLDGPGAAVGAAASPRELGHRPRRRLVHRAHGRRARRATRRCTSAPTARSSATYRKIHMFDVEVGGRVYKESAHEAPGRRDRRSPRPPTAPTLGLTDLLRRPLPRALPHPRGHAAREIVAVPAAFTFATTRDHWEVLLRARAIEGQAFVVAANQVGEHAPGIRSGGRSMIVDPWGVVLATAPDTRDVHRRRAGPRAPGGDPPHAALAGQPAARRPTLAGPRSPRSGGPKQAPVDKRRIILDAAVRVFAREGFHTCRVSDIADEAGVAYGLVYHYFKSKDQVLDTLFLERWDVLLEAIRETDAPRAAGRARSCIRSPASSSTPTVTIPT